MRLILFFLFCISIKTQLLAQGTVFQGVLTYGNQKEEFISFKIDFSVDNERIKGHAITDPGGRHETKNVITGRYSKNKKTIYIEEKKIIYTKSKEPLEKFCFIKINGTIKKSGDIAYLNGTFKGSFSDGSPCLQGSVRLISQSGFDKLLSEGTRFLESDQSVKDSIGGKFNPTKMIDSLSTNFLLKDEVLTYYTDKSHIEVVIFDHDKEDGDRVRITFNDKVIADDLVVLKKEKIFKLLLAEGDNWISILATSEGSMEPNTASIILDNQQSGILRAQLRENETAKIKIIRSQP